VESLLVSRLRSRLRHPDRSVRELLETEMTD
jgi:hypothetical protein